MVTNTIGLIHNDDFYNACDLINKVYNENNTSIFNFCLKNINHIYISILNKYENKDDANKYFLKLTTKSKDIYSSIAFSKQRYEDKLFWDNIDDFKNLLIAKKMDVTLYEIKLTYRLYRNSISKSKASKQCRNKKLYNLMSLFIKKINTNIFYKKVNSDTFNIILEETLQNFQEGLKRNLKLQKKFFDGKIKYLPDKKAFMPKYKKGIKNVRKTLSFKSTVRGGCPNGLLIVKEGVYFIKVPLSSTNLSGQNLFKISSSNKKIKHRLNQVLKAQQNNINVLSLIRLKLRKDKRAIDVMMVFKEDILSNYKHVFGSNEIAVDVNTKDGHIYHTNNHETFSNPYYNEEKEYLNKVKKNQKLLSRAKSLNKKDKYIKNINKYHNKLSKRRKQGALEQVKKMTYMTSVVYIEDLTPGTIKAKKQGKGAKRDSQINPLGVVYNELVEYVKKYDITTYLIPAYYTSQRCSICQEIMDIKSKKTHTCEHCGTTHNRDYNAATNIFNIAKSYNNKKLEKIRIK